MFGKGLNVREVSLYESPAFKVKLTTGFTKKRQLKEDVALIVNFKLPQIFTAAVELNVYFEVESSR